MQSPFIPVSTQDKIGYGKSKLESITSAAKTKVAKGLDISNDVTKDVDKQCMKYRNLDKLIGMLKEKCGGHAAKREKVRLLTLVQDSWSIKKKKNSMYQNI